MLREIGKTIQILKFDKWNEFCNENYQKKLDKKNIKCVN
jgi:hypothetical protein